MTEERSRSSLLIASAVISFACVLALLIWALLVARATSYEALLETYTITNGELLRSSTGHELDRSYYRRMALDFGQLLVLQGARLGDEEAALLDVCRGSTLDDCVRASLITSPKLLRDRFEQRESPVHMDVILTLSEGSPPRQDSLRFTFEIIR